MPKIIINNKEIEFEDGMTVLQACELAGVEIPRFCYHEKLSIAGNCRMCLVEMEKSPNPIASCAMPAADGMKIKTNTNLVDKARKGVMEFLLSIRGSELFLFSISFLKCLNKPCTGHDEPSPKAQIV